MTKENKSNDNVLQISENELDQVVESSLKSTESEEGITVNFFCGG